MITVKFFARLRDQLDTDELQLTIDQVRSTEDVVAHLIALHPHWQAPLTNSQLLVAVNQIMAQPGSPVADGDEVAFFPPVTGG